MDSLSSIEVSATILSLAIVSYGIYRNASAQTLDLPPGPPPDFLIGNLRQVPLKDQDKVFAEWGKKYGSFLDLLVVHV
jgi:hypothetical protein